MIEHLYFADRPIVSALRFVDLQADAIYKFVSELDICIPETEVEDADRIGEDAVTHYQDDVEAIRHELASLAAPTQPKHQLSVILEPFSPAVSVVPQLSAA
jgi:hypothetical protein